VTNGVAKYVFVFVFGIRSAKARTAVKTDRANDEFYGARNLAHVWLLRKIKIRKEMHCHCAGAERLRQSLYRLGETVALPKLRLR
jgi:hypothetical protein